MAEPVRHIPKDEEVVAAATQVILEHEVVEGQSRFLALVLKEMRRRDPLASLTGERLRTLALRSGLVVATIRVRVDGRTPDLDRCPVCRSPLRRTANRTLGGTHVNTGYRCSRCSWWTGPKYRIPRGYTFAARLARAGSPQTRFNLAGKPKGGRSHASLGDG